MYTSRLEFADTTVMVSSEDYTPEMLVYGTDKLPGMSGVVKEKVREVKPGVYEYRVDWYFLNQEKMHKSAKKVKDRSTQKSPIRNVLTRDMSFSS